MDIKIFLCILLVFVTLELQKTTATIPGITLSIKNGENRGDKATATCTLNMDDLVTTTRGENDPNGFPGLVGPVIGPKGIQGDPGIRGRHGMYGPKGFIGDFGIPGMRGEKGEPGFDITDSIGQPGERGLPGPRGSPGAPGPMGGCGCGPVGDPKKFGQKGSPAKVTCKSAPPGVTSGYYYMGPPGQAFKVYCKMDTKETCIRTKTGIKAYLSFGNGNSWFTSHAYFANALYNDLSNEQITWLQLRSATARQRLTYICKDFRNVNDNFDLTTALRFLSWNDMEIGPNATSDYPFFYSVPSDSDGCLTRGLIGRQSYSIIELETTKVFRLPITDLWMNDIGKPEESLNLRNIELCFG